MDVALRRFDRYYDIIRANALAIAVNVAVIVWLVCRRPSPVFRGLFGLDAAPCVVAMHGLATVVVMGVWSYWAHRIAHWRAIRKVPFVNLHARVHHWQDPDLAARLPPWGRVAIEAANNYLYIAGAGAVPFVTRWLDWRAVLFYGVTYTLIHNVNYHLPGYSGFHRGHHARPDTNFGPSLADAVYGTYDHPGPEDIRHFVPTVVIAAIAVALLDRPGVA